MAILLLLARWGRPLQVLAALWILCAVAGSRGRVDVVAVAASTPAEYALRDSSGSHLPVEGFRLERRQAEKPVTATRLTALPHGWLSIARSQESAAPAPPRPTTTTPSRFERGTRILPGQVCSPCIIPTLSPLPGQNKNAAGDASTGTAGLAKPGIAAARIEGGIKSPIQHRPLALVVSMPFSVAGLGLTLVLFILMLRGSAAIDNHARRAIQSAKMGNQFVK